VLSRLAIIRIQSAVAAILGTGPDAVVAVLDFIPISLVETGVYWSTFISSLCSSRDHHACKPNVELMEARICGLRVYPNAKLETESTAVRGQ
jgi:hypothetical protein